MVYKQCGRCKKIKHFIEFYNYRRGVFGLSSSCKQCDKEVHAEYYRKNKDRVDAIVNRWRKKNQDVRRLSEKRYAARNKEKIKAHYLFKSKTRAGQIKKQPCVICGCTNVHGHHEDYDRPFDVVWLCPLHHVGVHRGTVSLDEIGHIEPGVRSFGQSG